MLPTERFANLAHRLVLALILAGAAYTGAILMGWVQ